MLGSAPKNKIVNLRAAIKKFQTTLDPALMDRIVQDQGSLVRFIAKKFVGQDEPIEDLIQEGSLGLVNAIKNFDLNRQTEFSTYAVENIKGKIKNYFREHGRMIKIPANVQSLLRDMGREEQHFFLEYGRSPKASELAELLDESVERVHQLISIRRNFDLLSLDFLVQGGGHDGEGYGRGEGNLEYLLGSDPVDDPAKTILEIEEKQALIDCMESAGLTKEEDRVVRRRYFTDSPGTLSAIGKERNVTKERIRQIEVKALKKLRFRLVSDEHFRSLFDLGPPDI